MIIIAIESNKQKEVLDITEEINRHLNKLEKSDGVCNIFLLHTTAALSVADLDSGGTDLDYLEAFEKIIPKIKFRHPHNPAHMPDHILSSLIGVSLSLPFKNRKLVLGTWQRVVMIELDGPRERKMLISF